MANTSSYSMGGRQFVLTITGENDSSSNFSGEFRGAVEEALLNFTHGEVATIQFTGAIFEHKLSLPANVRKDDPIRVIRIGNPKKA